MRPGKLKAGRRSRRSADPAHRKTSRSTGRPKPRAFLAGAQHFPARGKAGPDRTSDLPDHRAEPWGRGTLHPPSGCRSSCCSGGHSRSDPRRDSWIRAARGPFTGPLRCAPDGPAGSAAQGNQVVQTGLKTLVMEVRLPLQEKAGYPVVSDLLVQLRNTFRGRAGESVP